MHKPTRFRSRGERHATLLQRLCSIPPFAHHPTCSCFDHHLVRIGRAALCLGCSSLVVGLLLGAAAILATGVLRPEVFIRVGWLSFVGAGILCYVPTLIQPYVQRKCFKITSRMLLGVGIVLLWFGSMALLPATLLGLCLRAIFVGVFFAVVVLTLRFRRAKSSCPSQNCSAKPFPFCRENLVGHRCEILAAAKASPCGPEQVFARALALHLPGTPDS